MSAPNRAVLAIDTAAPAIGVAGVSVAGASLVWSERVTRGADSVLLPAIARILHTLDQQDAELVGVAVSVGPGTFTGLRVGLAAALGVAVARRVPVFPEGSLITRARLCSHRPLLVLLDARKSRFYGRWFGTSGPPSEASDRPLVDWLAEVPAGGAIAVGEGALVARAELEAAGIEVWTAAGEVPARLLAEAALAGQIDALDAAQVTLQYVRPPDARKPVHVLTPT